MTRWFLVTFAISLLASFPAHARGSEEKLCSAINQSEKQNLNSISQVTNGLNSLLVNEGDEGVICVVYESKSKRNHGLLKLKWDERDVVEVRVERPSEDATVIVSISNDGPEIYSYVEQKSPGIGSWEVAYEKLIVASRTIGIESLLREALTWRTDDVSPVFQIRKTTDGRTKE